MNEEERRYVLNFAKGIQDGIKLRMEELHRITCATIMAIMAYMILSLIQLPIAIADIYDHHIPWMAIAIILLMVFCGYTCYSTFTIHRDRLLMLGQMDLDVLHLHREIIEAAKRGG